MTIGTLVKISAQKKLMMKISESAFMNISARLTAECKKKNFPTERLATFSLTNDDGEENYFVMISLDKYDKQNMRKFEQLLKKDVAFQYRFKSYDFIPDGEDEQRCGINLELISIRQVKPKIDPVVWLKGIAAAEIDEIADKAAARAINPAKELNAEEQAIDEYVEKAVAARLPSPPVLERQNAVRRRRTPAGERKLSPATEQELTGVAAEVKKLEDLIAANERAIGADE